jgi:putative ABC transport system permease protein
MSILSRFRNRWRERQLTRDFNDELTFHVEARVASNMRKGMSPTEARAEARRHVGNLTAAREGMREARVRLWIDDVLQDLRIGARMLIKRRGVTAIAIVSLALGIGVNAAVLSLVRAVLFDPLPYREPDRLVMIWSLPPGEPNSPRRANGPEYLAWKARATSFEAIGTEGQMVWELGADQDGTTAERVNVQRLTSSMFDLLGVQPVIGRAFRPDEEPVGGPAPVVLLSERLWERRFARDPLVLGRAIRLNGVPTTIVGVMPARFIYLSNGEIDVFIPFAFSVAQTKGSGRGYAPLARLKLGVSVAQAQTEMTAIASQFASELPAGSQAWDVLVQPLHEALRGGYREGLTLVQVAVVLVLLIGCANLAGLLIAAGTSRRTELAVRAAIGAGRTRLIRQLLTETALLAFVGGLAGVGVAWVTLHLLFVDSMWWLPQLRTTDLSVHIVTSTLALTVLAAMLCGVLPAIRGSRDDLARSLSAARSSSQGTSRHRFRRGLVIAQLALGFVLLVGAGLTVHSFLKLKNNDLRADPNGVLTFGLMFPSTRFQQQVGSYNGFPLSEVSPLVAATIERTWEAVRSIPGVESAAGNNHVPFTGGGPEMPFVIEGRPRPVSERELQAFAASAEIVTPDFLKTMKIPIVRGRDFDARDSASSPWGLVINETMAAKFWPNEDPIGKRVTFTMIANDRPREVIGVARDVLSNVFLRTSPPAMYSLYSQQPPHQLCRPACAQERLGMNFIVRTNGDRQAVVAAIRQTMAEVDRDRPITEVRLLEDGIAMTLSAPRWMMTVLSALATLATLLAAIGLYGVLAHGVAERTREIGVRMALGASRRSVWILVIGQLVADVAIGLAIGIGSALALTRLATNFVWGIAPNDPVTFATVAVLMVLVAFLAGAVPTARALRVSPTLALRSE